MFKHLWNRMMATIEEDPVAKLPLAAAFSTADVSVHLHELHRPCGHVGLIVDMWRLTPERTPALLLDEQELRDVLLMLADCHTFIEGWHAQRG